MSNRAQGRKISDFLANTTLPADTQLTLISGGVNYSISLADFQSSLGVTGSIVQDGDPTGTPVLDTQGSVNNIRNLEIDSNSGISALVSAQNGIRLALDAQSAGVGVPVLDTDNTIRKLLAGPGIAIAAAGGDIQISTSVVPGASNIIVVNALSDFPAPSGGVIALLADTVYFINSIISIGANTFTLASKTAVIGLSAITTGIVSTATGNLFSNIGGFKNKISHISIDAVNCTIFNINFATAVSRLDVAHIDITACVSICNINKCDFVEFDNINTTICSGDVYKFSGQCDRVVITSSLIEGFTGTVFALNSSVFKSFTAMSTEIVSVLGTNKVIEGLTSSANMAVGSLGVVQGVVVEGTFAAPVTILATDIRWSFQANNFIADSSTNALLSMQSNATNTVITVAGTPVLVAGTWVVENNSKMTGTTAGRVTYDAQAAVTPPVVASLTISPVSGPTQTLAVYVALNGTIIANSKRTTAIPSGVSSSVTVPWLLTLNTSDYIEIFVANDSNTNNILVSSAVMRVG